MKSKFKKLLKGVFLSSVASIISTNGVKAAPYDLSHLNSDGDNLSKKNKENDLSQKYILKIHDDNSYLIAGHRSHRSHSSHRSSSSGSTYRGSSSSSSTYRSSSSSSTIKVYSLGERIITVGTSGKDVRELATLFITIAYITEAELTKDILGNVTCCNKLSNAISKFQRANNLTVDGIAGKATIKYLKNHVPNYSTTKSKTSTNVDQKINLGDRVLRKGMQGTDVTQLKNILIDKGFLSLPFAKSSILFDENIEKAVIGFQKKTGIDADGIVETQTVYFLKKQ